MLAQLQTLIDTCALLPSRNERMAKFRELAAPIKDLIRDIYDPFQRFGVTRANVDRREKSLHMLPPTRKPRGRPPSLSRMAPFAPYQPMPDTLHELIQLLSERTIRGYEALDTCIEFIHRHEEHRDVILRALQKDLSIRVGVKMVNEVFPFLVPTFSCALSLSWDDHQAFYQSHQNQFYISRKLDGIRCLIVCQNGQVKAFSRSGHMFPDTITPLQPVLAQFAHQEDGVFDGEMGVVDAQHKEYFNEANSIMTPSTKKSKELPKNKWLCYFAFDWIPLAEFQAGEGKLKWSERQKQLRDRLPLSASIKLLEQYPASEMDYCWEEAQEKGWEGLIVRLDTGYKGKKSRDMLKRKLTFDEEFIIEEATLSEQMSPDSCEKVPALEHVGITVQGCRVWVGSGFTWAERLDYARRQHELIGWTITVQHNGLTKNQQGGVALRHPRKKALYPCGRTT